MCVHVRSPYSGRPRIMAHPVHSNALDGRARTCEGNTVYPNLEAILSRRRRKKDSRMNNTHIPYLPFPHPPSPDPKKASRGICLPDQPLRRGVLLSMRRPTWNLDRRLPDNLVLFVHSDKMLILEEVTVVRGVVHPRVDALKMFQSTRMWSLGTVEPSH